MRVYELIDLLKKCNPDDFVMYDMKNSIANENLIIRKNDRFDSLYTTEKQFSVDDVFVGSGTLKGFVYLREDRQE